MNRLENTGSLQAMSTTIAIISVGIPDAQHRHAMSEVAIELEAWEQRFSRFRPDSMLSSVNSAAGAWVSVDTVFIDLLKAAQSAVVATEGRFNPAILDAIEAQGYDRTIDAVRKRSSVVRAQALPVSSASIWAEVELNRPASRIRLPEGMRIDFGGIAKGALADRLADRYSDWPGGAISIGGDISVWGEPPDGDCWRVGIEHPLEQSRDIIVVDLPSGIRTAIATSSRTKRSWQTNAGNAHHLIDPFTGSPTNGPLLAVSACAASALDAEVTTKNLMVASAHGPLTPNLLLNARWALAIPDSLHLTRIEREAA